MPRPRGPRLAEHEPAPSRAVPGPAAPRRARPVSRLPGAPGPRPPAPGPRPPPVLSAPASRAAYGSVFGQSSGGGRPGSGWPGQGSLSWPGVQAQAERRTVRGARGGAVEGAGRAWLAGPEMDTGQDQDPDRSAVSQDDDAVGDFADAAASWVESSGSGPSCSRARRSRGGRLAEGCMAARGNTAAALGAWIVFEDEAGFSMTPPTSRTWSRRGTTPVIRVRGRSQRRFSIAALCCYKPGERSRLIYWPRQHADHLPPAAGRPARGRRS